MSPSSGAVTARDLDIRIGQCIRNRRRCWQPASPGVPGWNHWSPFDSCQSRACMRSWVTCSYSTSERAALLQWWGCVAALCDRPDVAQTAAADGGVSVGAVSWSHRRICHTLGGANEVMRRGRSGGKGAPPNPAQSQIGAGTVRVPRSQRRGTIPRTTPASTRKCMHTCSIGTSHEPKASSTSSLTPSFSVHSSASAPSFFAHFESTAISPGW